MTKYKFHTIQNTVIRSSYSVITVKDGIAEIDENNPVHLELVEKYGATLAPDKQTKPLIKQSVKPKHMTKAGK